MILSSSDFTNDNLQDDYVHLTNNAIQKSAPNYGQYEEGNQLSFQDLRAWFKNSDTDFDKDILPKIKYQTYVAFQSVSLKFL